MEKNTTTVNPEAQAQENNSKEVKFKKRSKNATFFAIIGDYLKKHPMAALWIVLFTAVSSASAVFGPKIIQNMMTNLMAPMTVKQIFLSMPTNDFTGVVSSDQINQILQAGNAGFVYIGGNLTVQSTTDLINQLSHDSKHFATKLFGLKLNWMHWIYVQLGLFGLTAITTFLSNYIAGIMGKDIEIELRNKSLEKLVKQDMSYYSDKKIGEILTKIVSDTQIIGDQAQQVPIAMLSACFTFFGSLAMMFTIDVKLTVVVIVLMAVILVIIFGSFGLMRKLAFKVRKSITEINGDVTDRIATVRLIKASGTENYETERFIEIHKDYYKKSVKMITAQSVIITVLVAGISSIQMVIVIAGALIYNDDAAFLAVTLSSFISGVGTMVSPIMQLTRVVGGLVQASTSSTRVDEVIKSEARFNSHYDEGDGIQVQGIEGNIQFKEVEFRYPEKPEKLILPRFNFTFEHGKSYAFVGETGAGKSTIAKLLLRFYDPSHGEILINEKTNLKDVHLSSYLDKVGYVEQEPQILFGTVLDNIKYGRFDATDEEALEAAKKAELHNLVMGWPDGYDTILGERGFMLSGGQKQRLVIARMILKDPQLLILDEATSALDNIVEAEIQAELDKLMKGRTTVTIAHRLSTIKNCDQIIVLARDEGIAQIGTFNELKTKPGHFKRLYEAGLME